MNPFKWSRKITQRIEKTILGGFCMETVYRDAIGASVARNAVVLDAGAGEQCVFATQGLHVIGADILIADLRKNPDIQCAVVSDLGSDMPFRPNSIDAVTACYFVEHIRDTERFIRNVASVLKPGGRLFMLFPCRYAPFAVVNRWIPNRLTIKLLRRFVSDSHGGFPASYDNCWPRRMREILDQNQMRVLKTELCYYQSHYYASFLPAYLLSVAYEKLVKTLGVEAAAASVCIFAEKTQSGAS